MRWAPERRGLLATGTCPTTLSWFKRKSVCSHYKIVLALCLGLPGLLFGVTDLTPELKAASEEFGLPALAAVVVKNGEVVAEGVVGTRRLGADIPATLDDKFHIGSSSKAMIAFLAAKLVEQGKLSWDLTVEEAFPELKEKTPEPLRSATLQQMFSHSSGLPGDNDALMQLYFGAHRAMLPLPELRMWVIERALALPAAGAPGEKFAYSNLGYIVAGAMIERAAGSSWEELMHELLFKPMGLKTAGIGPQASAGLVDAPLPHFIENGEVLSIVGGPSSDIPAVMGPAGTVHMSPRDFAKWALWNATMGKSQPDLLMTETIRKLHTPQIPTSRDVEESSDGPETGHYALGWGVSRFPWSDKVFLQHRGSNGMNLALIVVLPEQELALVLTSNIGGPKAQLAFGKLSKNILQKFLD